MRGLRLRVDLDPTLEAVTADPGRVRQLLHNLRPMRSKPWKVTPMA